jgi:hypothetical protein
MPNTLPIFLVTAATDRTEPPRSIHGLGAAGGQGFDGAVKDFRRVAFGGDVHEEAALLVEPVWDAAAFAAASVRPGLMTMMGFGWRHFARRGEKAARVADRFQGC